MYQLQLKIRISQQHLTKPSTSGLNKICEMVYGINAKETALCKPSFIMGQYGHKLEISNNL
jgi:hypothetical protein